MIHTATETGQEAYTYLEPGQVTKKATQLKTFVILSVLTDSVEVLWKSQQVAKVVDIESPSGNSRSYTSQTGRFLSPLSRPECV